MLVFPHAKINLGLHILRKRNDGFHDLETCFYPVKSLTDALEVIQNSSDDSSIKTYNTDWQGPIEDNLVWKAFQMFREYEPGLIGFDWHLFKKIPSGGGLGGGSSDATFALKMLADICDWSQTDPRLQKMASSLGSDCAFFLHNSPMLGTGRGEELTPIDLSEDNFRVEFVFPGIHISTAQAFANIKPSEPQKGIAQILLQPKDTWKEELKNDFEASVFPKFPELAKIKEELYEKGAFYASMSGSGSTMFGLFAEN
jgi:4-diphosphocytidyl-2-C-methyl-D-erythritol kinase